MSRARVLIVDDDTLMAETTRDILEASGHEADAVFSGAEALARLRLRSYDCVLSDIRMPGLDGVELCRAIRAAQPDLPVALMTAYSDHRLVGQGRREGVLAVMSKPLDIDRLRHFCSLLEHELSIVIVDDDPLFCQTLGDSLRIKGYQVCELSDPHEVPGGVQEEAQVAILDMKLGRVSGLDVLLQLREHRRRIQVILVTGYAEEMAPLVQQAMGLGVRALFPKPVPVQDLLELIADIRREVLSNALTGTSWHSASPVSPPVS